MPTTHQVIRNTYRDSVALMQISARAASLPGIDQAAVVMATEGNLALLRQAKLIDAPVSAAPSDLLIVLSGTSDAALTAALRECEQALLAAAAVDRQAAAMQPRSIEMALAATPEANFALVSTPGDYAAAEALKALHLGLHVMLFSDNVSIADELMLKRAAGQCSLLLMGPDCGTAIISGVPLGFANAVRRGPVGVIGASGTGMQQLTCLLDRAGIGVSHALGTGGRDLSEAIGGLSTLQALDELAADAQTKVIVLVSKPPAPSVASRVLQRAAELGKPVVACFLGTPAGAIKHSNIYAAPTLEDAAEAAAALARGAQPSSQPMPLPSFNQPRFQAEQRYLRALYSGGTFCYEATLLSSQQLRDVHSNTPVGGVTAIADVWRSQAHTLVDLGDDEFTRGRPHPMIDHRLRNERILREAADAQVRVILFDVVLGFGAHADPAAEMLPTINAAQALAHDQQRPLALVAFVCGTQQDPQDLARQEAALRDAGVMLATSNAQAVRIALRIANG